MNNNNNNPLYKQFETKLLITKKYLIKNLAKDFFILN